MVGMLTGGTVYALHSDQTGRVLVITDTSQNVAWDAKGLAFTRNTTSGNPDFFRPGFPGQYWDVEDNLWHNGYRDYNPTLGRYIESDPIGLGGGLNTYAYVGSNPISAIDLLGLCPKCTQAQKFAATVASKLAGDADFIGQVDTVLGAETLGAAALEVPSLGTDTPITATLATETAAVGAAGAATQVTSDAFNAYAGGGARSFFSFLTAKLASTATKFAALAITHSSEFADVLGDAVGDAVGKAAVSPHPCQLQ